MHTHIVANCQSHGNQTLKHALLCHVFYYQFAKWTSRVMQSKWMPRWTNSTFRWYDQCRWQANTIHEVPSKSNHGEFVFTQQGSVILLAEPWWGAAESLTAFSLSNRELTAKRAITPYFKGKYWSENSLCLVIYGVSQRSVILFQLGIFVMGNMLGGYQANQSQVASKMHYMWTWLKSNKLPFATVAVAPCWPLKIT